MYIFRHLDMLNHLIMLYGLTSLIILPIDMDIISPQDQKYGNKQVRMISTQVNCTVLCIYIAMYYQAGFRCVC